MEKAGQPRILKKHNKSRIRKLIKEQGPITKPEMAQLTNLSLPTVNKITDELVAEGYAIAAAIQKCPGAGRKARTYVINENYGTFLVVCYMGAKWLGCVVNITGSIVYEIQCEAVCTDRKPQIQVLTGLLDVLQSKSKRTMAIGVGVPGIVRRDGRLEGIPLLPDFEGMDLGKILKERYELPVYIENDVKLMTVGYRKLCMNDMDNIVFLYIGNGLGAGILLNGALYKGNCSFAGEFGYMPSGRPRETGNEAAEKTAEESGIETAKEANLEERLTFLRTKLKENPGDPEYRRQFCTEISRALVFCITVINPDAIVIYCDEMDDESTKDIQQNIGEHIPATCVPQVRHTSNRRMGIDGLICLCQEDIAKKNWMLDVG